MKCEKCRNAEHPKPSWGIAPSWANFLARGKYGEWTWFENQPAKWDEWWEAKGRQLAYSGSEWEYTLERRPK